MLPLPYIWLLVLRLYTFGFCDMYDHLQLQLVFLFLVVLFMTAC